MTHFKLDTSKFSDNSTRYKEYYRKCNEDISSVYGNLKNVDAGCDAPLTKVFIDAVKTDCYKFGMYFDKLNSMYMQVTNMNEEFKKLLIKYKYKSNSIIDYDDAYYDACVRSLRQVVSYLNSALSYINSCNFKATFPEIYKVYALKSEVKQLKIDVNNLIASIILFKKSVDKIVLNTKYRVSKMGTLKINAELMTFDMQLVNFTPIAVDDTLNNVHDN